MIRGLKYLPYNKSDAAGILFSLKKRKLQDNKTAAFSLIPGRWEQQRCTARTQDAMINPLEDLEVLG